MKARKKEKEKGKKITLFQPFECNILIIYLKRLVFFIKKKSYIYPFQISQPVSLPVIGCRGRQLVWIKKFMTGFSGCFISTSGDVTRAYNDDVRLTNLRKVRKQIETLKKTSLK